MRFSNLFLLGDGMMGSRKSCDLGYEGSSVCKDRLRRGYTLMELMVVIAIIGLLAAATTVGVRHFLVRGKQKTARMEIAAIETALELYRDENHSYPEEGNLKVLEEKSKQTGEKFLKGDTIDPWSNQYDFYIEDGEVIITSYGSDGQAGGEGAARDITNLDSETEGNRSSP